jgi:hypothetical protein
VQSPLLRLPAELRNAIWKLAYSDGWVEVSLRNTGKRSGKHIRLSLYFEGSAPGLVCKQHRAEVIPIFMQTCTFSFNDNSAFKEFLTTGSSVLAQVRRIAIRLDLIRYFDRRYIDMSDARGWAYALREVSHLSDKLESLEGVQISAKSRLLNHWTAVPFAVFGHSVWEEAGLSEIVSFFQQYRLKEELTSCEVTGFEDIYEDDMDRLAQLSVEIREHLLDYIGYAHVEEYDFQTGVIGVIGDQKR